MKKLLKSLGAACLLGATLVSCSNSDKKFEVAENGVHYKFYVQNSDTLKPKVGEFVTVKMDYSLPDTALFSTNDIDQPFSFPVIESQFKGDFYQAIEMMSIGDSASFQFPADSIFTKMFGFPSLPDFVKPGDVMTFDVKLEKIQNREEFREEMQKRQEQYMKEREASAPNELKDYVEQNNITATPTADGLYVQITKKTDGAKPKDGDNVFVHYTGKLMDGTVFDSSFERDTPIDFVLGQGNVIRGWDEGISMLRVGEKATLVIPYTLAYGPQGRAPVIPPYANLVFDVELVSIGK